MKGAACYRVESTTATISATHKEDTKEEKHGQQGKD